MPALTRHLDPRRTSGQNWRRKRDLTIALAHRAGASARALAYVFDLSRARVAEILGALEAEARETETGRGREISRPAGAGDGARSRGETGRRSRAGRV